MVLKETSKIGPSEIDYLNESVRIINSKPKSKPKKNSGLKKIVVSIPKQKK